MAEDFAGLKEFVEQRQAPPEPPAAPASAPPVTDDFSGLKDFVANRASAAPALIPASFVNQDEEAQRRQLAERMTEYLGPTNPNTLGDAADAERRVRLAEADHATRASPRTQAWLSREENAKIALDDAKTLAEVERMREALVLGSQVLASHQGSPGREWHSAGGWLVSGDSINVVRAPLPEIEVES